MFYSQNRVESVLGFSVVFEKNKFFFSTTAFSKNNTFLWTNANSNVFFSKFNNNNMFFTLVDFVGYDKSLTPFILNLKNSNYFSIFYNYYSDAYLMAFFSQTNSISKCFFSSYWLERELKETFGIFFYNTNDTRNIFLEYSITTPVLLKKTPLEMFNNVKTRFNKLNVETAQSVEL